MRFVVIGAIATAIALGAAATGGGPTPPAPGTANIWMSLTGNDSTCTRSPVPIADPGGGADCITLNKSFSKVAACTDVIAIVSGDYSGSDPQTLADNAATDSCAQQVTIGSATGVRADVIFNQVASPQVNVYSGGGASWWTLQHVTIKQRYWQATGPTHFVLNDIDGGAGYMNGTMHAVIENSDFGPCWSDNSISVAHPCIDNVKVEGNADDTLYYRNNFHDFTETTNHFECLAAWDADNTVVDANHFWNCDIYDIAPSGNGPPDLTHTGLLIENNWFGRSNGGANQNGVGFQHGATWINSAIRYNSFSNTGITQTSGTAAELAGVSIVGNIGPFDACLTGPTYTVNLWVGGTCGAGDINIGVLPYTNTSDQSAGDYHLTGADGSTSADQLVPCTVFPGLLAHDYDIGVRPFDVGMNCDAGSDER